MFSAAWRPTAKIAVSKQIEVLTVRVRQAKECQANRFAAPARWTLKSLNRKSDITV